MKVKGYRAPTFSILDKSLWAIEILAEEGFSKAFLMYLVQDNAVPWTREIRRAIRNHECKHLLSLLMEYRTQLAARDFASDLLAC